MKYYIKQIQYIDELEEPYEPHYQVYYKRKILGLFPYKKYLKEIISDNLKDFRVNMDFESADDAELYIKHTLCLKRNMGTLKASVVREVDFNSGEGFCVTHHN